MNKTSGTGKEKIIDDPLGEWVDILGVNQYAAWYTLEKPVEIPQNQWSTVYDKPMIFSEFGAGALPGFQSDTAELWSEEYQADVYRYTLQMCESIPFLQGISPWILKDFRSPRRHHGVYQNYWNRKGLISHEGTPKKAFDVLKTWYNDYESK
jgi:beta-glucuronidase